MTSLTIKWNEFEVLKKHDIDKDKPYLWVFGIVIDGKSLTSHDFVIRKPCTSDNLGGQKFKKGDTTAVPSDLDISREVSPFLGLATAGVVVVAWENGTTRDSVIADAYDAAADTINDFVRDMLVELKFEPAPEDLIQLRADIEAEVRATIRAGSGVLGLLHDHNIGTEQTIVNLGEPFEQCLDYRFTDHGADYILKGDLSYGVPTPPGPPINPGDIPVKNQSPKPTSTVRH